MSDHGDQAASPDRDATAEVPRTPPPETEPVVVDRGARPRVDARPLRGSFVGMALMAGMLFVILSSATVVPWWGIALMVVIWLGALVRAIEWFMTRPRRVLLTPVVLFVVWLTILFVGAKAFGWGS